MQRLFYVVIATILIAACVGNGKEREVLDRVQAVINDHPDSALAISPNLLACGGSCSMLKRRTNPISHLLQTA